MQSCGSLSVCSALPFAPRTWGPEDPAPANGTCSLKPQNGFTSSLNTSLATSTSVSSRTGQDELYRTQVISHADQEVSMLKTENEAEASTSASGSGHCQVCAPGHVGQSC